MLFELAISLATVFMAPVQDKQQGVKTEVIFVKENKVPCIGVAPSECLQILKANGKEWTTLYGPIVGFDYVPGYRYRLKVYTSKVKNPPADGSSIRYTLVRILERTKMSDNQEAHATNSIFRQRWTLINMDGEDFKDSGIWMEFDQSEKRMHGRSGCNGMMGAYKLSGKVISFSKTAGTLMACPDTNLMHRETLFMKHLSDETFQYQVNGNVVTLFQNGAPVLKFKLSKKEDHKKETVKSDAVLGGRKWMLNKLNDTEISEAAGMYLEFDPQKKRFSGKGGCNNISGAYTINNSNISFKQGISTKMMCLDNDAMQKESEFLKTISEHNYRFQVDNNMLSVFENNTLVMQFTAEGSHPVASGNMREWAFIGSKKWNVIKLNDETLTNAGIWIEFDINKKKYNGKGGCNNIAGGYSATKDEITFSKAISTRMACPDPNIMKRESTFLDVLSKKTYRYDLADQTLNLYDNGGNIVIMFGMQNK